MESVRVFSALNIPLWLGGTRSANATQSIAFRAARRPAILTVCRVGGKLKSRQTVNLKTQTTFRVGQLVRHPLPPYHAV